METGVGIHLHLQTVNLTTLCGDKNCTLGCLGAVEHNSLGTLEEGDLLNLGRKHIV